MGTQPNRQYRRLGYGASEVVGPKREALAKAEDEQDKQDGRTASLCAQKLIRKATALRKSRITHSEHGQAREGNAAASEGACAAASEG